VIVLVPVATDAAPPVEVIVATLLFDDVQITDAVRSCVVLFEKVPMALNCWFVPEAMFEFAGVTEMETSVGGVKPLLPPPPQPAIAVSSSKRMKRLFDLIDIYPRWDQTRHICPSLQIPHVSPFFDNNRIRREFLLFTSEFASSLLLSGRIFTPIGTEELCEVGVNIAVPGDSEDNPGW
jgi:hypothetical protein